MKYGWDKLLLKDPDGKIQEEKRKGNLNAEERLVENFLDGESIPTEGWTSSLELCIPLLKSSFKIPGRKDILRMAMPFQRQKNLEPPENLSESTCFLDVMIRWRGTRDRR